MSETGGRRVIYVLCKSGNRQISLSIESVSLGSNTPTLIQLHLTKVWQDPQIRSQSGKFPRDHRFQETEVSFEAGGNKDSQKNVFIVV